MFRMLVGAVLVAMVFSATLGQEAPLGREAQLKDQLDEAFGPGSFDNVSLDGGQLRIRTVLPVVNDLVYLKVAVQACKLLEQQSGLGELRELVIMNRSEKQGYAYTAPAKCKALLEAPEEEVKSMLFADTRFCGRGCR